MVHWLEKLVIEAHPSTQPKATLSSRVLMCSETLIQIEDWLFLVVGFLKVNPFFFAFIDSNLPRRGIKIVGVGGGGGDRINDGPPTSTAAASSTFISPVETDSLG
jgi:hypothetical protein